MRVRKVFLCKYLAFLLVVSLWYYTIAVTADEIDKIEKTELPVYIIEPGDQLLITVAGHEKELTALVVVRPDGMITYPWVGDIEAAGLTVVELSQAISMQLSILGYYEDPQVTVQLKKSSGEIICVAGDVVDPGQKIFPRPANVVEVLAAAGWFEETADLTNARIIRTKGKQKEIIPIDLRSLLKIDITDQDVASEQLSDDKFMLEDGDVLVIPSSISKERINVIGHVHMPGQYQVRSAVSLVGALALAGGPLETTADLRRIRIIRVDGSVIIADATRFWNKPGEKHPFPDSLSPQNDNRADPAPREMVYPGDSVVVLEKGKINILGSVENQGQFDVDDEISIMEALALAGIADNASLKKLRVIRSTGEELIVDASKIWKQRGQEFEVTLGAGDTLIVPRAFKINWGAISTVVMTLSTLYAIFR